MQPELLQGRKPYPDHLDRSVHDVEDAERIAAATVNKQRREEGETKEQKSKE